MIVIVMVNLIDEDSAQQDIDLVGAVGDLDTVVVQDAPFLADISDLDVSLEDLKLPGHAVAGNLVVIFSGNINGDGLLAEGSPVVLFGNCPGLSALFPDKFLPWDQLGVVGLLEGGDLLSIHGSEGRLGSKLTWAALHLISI